MNDRNTQRRGGWRYQPVATYQNGEPTYTMIEVYVNEDGSVRSWTEDSAMVPQGDTGSELSRDLIRMLVDCWKWKPVNYNALVPGLVVERTGLDIEKIIQAMNDARGVVE